ncbi:EAL domain-containing protein [Thioalkalivibrio sp. K90mix]|uniref:EAL domain-containing protein n=1 Tax=Thioalkalivibrio sp. (strain K90mix) TaxID=396595 RepID=UPI003528934E
MDRLAHAQSQKQQLVTSNTTLQLLYEARHAALNRTSYLIQASLSREDADAFEGFAQADHRIDVLHDAYRQLVDSETAASDEYQAWQLALADTGFSQGLALERAALGALPIEELDAFLPRHAELDAFFGELMRRHAEAADSLRDSSSSDYAKAIVALPLLGGLSLIVGLLAGWLVYRRTARSESELFHEKERAQVTLHAIGDAVITTDLRGHVEYLNPVAEHLTGWTHDEAVNHRLDDVFMLIDASSGTRIYHPLTECVYDGMASGLRHDQMLVSRTGQQYEIEEVASPIRNRSGAIIGAALVFRDVTRSRSLERDLIWAARHDELTGLPNRAEFERRLRKMVIHARRNGIDHSLIYLDLDQFKVVNDTCGHPAGDELLRQLATQFQERLRSSDVLARLGGDEFGILLERCTLGEAEAIAEKIRASVAEGRFEWQGKVFTVGVSIGVAPIDPDTGDAEQFMSKADAACYLAKEAGRNRIHVTHSGDENVAYCEDHMHCVQAISEAIEADRLWLHGQNICPVSGKGKGYTEVLVRVLDQKGELLSPGTFIPAAERFGIMPQIDRWVIRRVLTHMANPGSGFKGRYSVNLSGQSLCDIEMLDFITKIFRHTRVDPSRICFEITETAAIANLDQASRFMKELRGLGCRFALDDFGVGMSSFGYLRDLKVDYIKIDGSFVRDMAEDPIHHAMVESIHHIGHVMGLETVAEFVSDPRLLVSLREIGIDYGQGFGLHRPEPLEPSPMEAKPPVWERPAALYAS